MCRICGLYLEDLRWGEDDKTPHYEICPCCGVEFGYEDYTVESAREYRSRWLAKGTPWFNPQERLLNWSLQEQMACIPEPFR